MRQSPLARLMRALTLAGAAVAAQAQVQGTLELHNTAQMEREIKTADGKVEVRLAPVVSAVPGTRVVYTTTFNNVGTEPASGVVIKSPVPPATTLVPGSPWGENTEITYSADGGKTWFPADQVKVIGEDGKERPAGIGEFTHVRWKLRSALPPGKRGQVGFRAVIN